MTEFFIGIFNKVWARIEADAILAFGDKATIRSILEEIDNEEKKRIDEEFDKVLGRKNGTEVC